MSELSNSKEEEKDQEFGKLCEKRVFDLIRLLLIVQVLVSLMHWIYIIQMMNLLHLLIRKLEKFLLMKILEIV